MRRRLVEEVEEVSEVRKKDETVVVPHDPTNEAIVIAAALSSPEMLKKLSRRIVVDHFVAPEHRTAWTSLVDISRRGLAYDAVAVEQMSGRQTAQYLEELRRIRPTPPANLEWHLENLFWDAARTRVAKGPVPSFLELLRDPKAQPDRVKSLARAIVSSFEGYEDRKHLRDPSQLTVEVMRDIEERIAGRAFYPYGIRGLDYYELGVTERNGTVIGGTRRMLPGAAPGQVTVITGNSGSGKSTFTLNVVLGLLESGRKILYGAWEQGPKISLELIACLQLGWSRTEMRVGEGPIATAEGRERFRDQLLSLEGKIRVLENAFRRRGGDRPNNMRNLDILQSYLGDSGCDVFIGDLWKRSIVADDPAAEEEALIRQQAMAEEEQIHCILLQQQRLKDNEKRIDTRPTREGIKGSAAWVEVADTIIGIHRPGESGAHDDDKLEALILKQRYGRWPMGVSFAWDGERGLISGGTTFQYTKPGEANEMDTQIEAKKTKWAGTRRD